MCPNGVESLISNIKKFCFCFFGVLSRIFSAKLSNSVEFLLRIYLEMTEFIGPWYIGKRVSFQVYYPAALFICSQLLSFFFF